MPTVFDVAAHLLIKLAPDRTGPHLTTWKLQKLVYYCQAWSLVWDEREMFAEPIQAWADGPVCPALREKHKGGFYLHAGDIAGNPDALDKDALETIDAVLDYYGDKDGRYLSNLTHMELPWREARGDTPIGLPSDAVISQEAMVEYYGGLLEVQ